MPNIHKKHTRHDDELKHGEKKLFKTFFLHVRLLQQRNERREKSCSLKRKKNIDTINWRKLDGDISMTREITTILIELLGKQAESASKKKKFKYKNKFSNKYGNMVKWISTLKRQTNWIIDVFWTDFFVILLSIRRETDGTVRFFTLCHWKCFETQQEKCYSNEVNIEYW